MWGVGRSVEVDGSALPTLVLGTGVGGAGSGPLCLRFLSYQRSLSTSCVIPRPRCRLITSAAGNRATAAVRFADRDASRMPRSYRSANVDNPGGLPT
jgi:hypothetical protein